MTEPKTDPTAFLLERLAETFPDQPAPLPSIIGAAHVELRRRRRRNGLLVGAVVTLGLSGGLAVDQMNLGDRSQRSTDQVAATTGPSCDKNNPVPPSSSIPSGPDYPTNAAGQTYGAAMDGDSPQPDLIAVIGDCGQTGYISRDRFAEQPPWAPGAGSSELQSVPVYESDGLTQIDTFTQERGTSIEGGATSSPAPTTGPDGADLLGTWKVQIVGIGTGDGKQYDTYRDLDLRASFAADGSVDIHTGCRDLLGSFSLEAGAFAATEFDVSNDGSKSCAREAPLAAIFENVRYVTQSREDAYLHLENFRIALALRRAI